MYVGGSRFQTDVQPYMIGWVWISVATWCWVYMHQMIWLPSWWGGEGFHSHLSVCLSAWYVEKWCSQDHQTWNTCIPWWILETHLFWSQKLKVARHQKQACVRLHTECNIAACCIRKLCWVFPTAMPHYTSHASDTGFFCVAFSWPMLLPTAGFPCMEFLQLAKHCPCGSLHSCECWLLSVVIIIITSGCWTLSVCRGRTVRGRQFDWCVSFIEGRTLCRRWWS